MANAREHVEKLIEIADILDGKRKPNPLTTAHVPPMSLSVLIQTLQLFLAEHGDMPVCISDCDDELLLANLVIYPQDVGAFVPNEGYMPSKTPTGRKVCAIGGF